ncbi:MAG: M20 family metallopeptidase [Actinomycetota bacterium]|nr:M20 family metallopeptidase [Actinomycetota bacterium]MEC9425077.1 M20 family metallopeptidase [Actinomycetota bacterium]MED6328124.1 M20 family metallopeptidase [Actinomycetota bacterium]MEE2958031.1 M20 family metallopeptidase [Actinomycetota bacterium]
MSNKQVAQQAFDRVEMDLRDLSRWMYENPELGYEEFEASARISAFLGDNGFDVTYPSHGLDTAFEATVGTSGPRVVICCEYDALPEVGHACGHNVIATSAVGAGVALAPLAEELGIRVTVLGTPAEEGGGGKVELIDAGAFEDAAASMMVHPGPYDELDPSFMACQHYDVEFFGKDSHAAFAPEEGINALDAFVQAYVNVSTLRQAMVDGDRVHCMVTHGGDAVNVVPSHTKSEWLIRSQTVERLRELVPKVKACFEGAALATGCRFEWTPTAHPYDSMVNNEVMTGLYAANSEELGRPMPACGGEARAGGSSDMGNVSQVVPSIHPMLGLDCGDAVNHQPEFADATVAPGGEVCLRDGALGMAWTVIDMAEKDVWDRLGG